MIGYIFGKAIDILKRKPFMLWGVSLLCIAITMFVSSAGAFVPIISVPVILTLSAGMSALYLDGYNGKEVNSKQLFAGFSRECISRVPAGMLWYILWNYIWAFVPVAGIIKSYSYSFMPYILLTEKDVDVFDALKLSMKRTDGYKLKMFCADLIMGFIAAGLILIFALFMIIPVIGWIIGIVGIVAVIICYPLFSGLVKAGFYEEIKSGRFRHVYYNYNQTPPVYNTWECSNCGSVNEESHNFCSRCGSPKN